MSRAKLQFGRFDYAVFSASIMYALCSLSIPLMIVAIGQALNFPLDQGGMAAGGSLHLTRSITMLVALMYLKITFALQKQHWNSNLLCLNNLIISAQVFPVGRHCIWNGGSVWIAQKLRLFL